MAVPEFVYLSQVLDGQESVIRVPRTSLSTWLPRGWSPCDPPAKRRPSVEEPAVAPAPVKPTPTSKKAERSASGPESKSEAS